MIDTVDPYLPMYVFEKMEHPENPMVIRQFKRNDVLAVDRIIELAGHRETVQTMKDWGIVGMLFDWFARRWPAEYQEFKDAVPDIRSSRGSKGYSKSKEMMYLGAMPPRFMKIVKIIFPYQQFDKKFVNKLVKKMPLFKISGEGN